MTLAAAPGNQRMKNTLDINAIGLHAPSPAVDLKLAGSDMRAGIRQIARHAHFPEEGIVHPQAAPPISD